MPNLTTRFVTRNHAVGSTATLKTPLPPAAAQFPAVNLVHPDRDVKAVMPAGSGTVTAVVDVGVGRTTNVVGYLGAEFSPGFLTPSQFSIAGGATYPDPSTAAHTNGAGNSVLTSDAGNFTTMGVHSGMTVTGLATLQPGTTVVSITGGGTTLILSLPATGTASGTVVFSDFVNYVSAATMAGVRDFHSMLLSPVGPRYWRATFASVSADFALGKLLVGSVADLGIAYSPGSTEALVRQRVRNDRANGGSTLTTTGPDRTRVGYRFGSVPRATLDVLLAQAAMDTIVLLSPNGATLELDLKGDALEWSAVFGPPDLFNVTLAGESLP